MAMALVWFSECTEAAPVRYAFPGLHGKVVADESGRPLAGVSILAVWISTAPAEVLDTLRVEETESREDGSFELPAWEATFHAPIDTEKSVLALFMPGRELGKFMDRRIADTSSPAEIRLPVFTGSEHRWAVDLKQFTVALALAWVQYQQRPPRMLSRLNREWQTLSDEARGDASNPLELFYVVVDSMRAEIDAYKRRGNR